MFDEQYFDLELSSPEQAKSHDLLLKAQDQIYYLLVCTTSDSGSWIQLQDTA